MINKLNKDEKKKCNNKFQLISTKVDNILIIRHALFENLI